MTPEELTVLAQRINTLPLQRERHTVALVVFNPLKTAYNGLAVFWARFPVREETGPQSVTLRDAAGKIIPSRRTNEDVYPDSTLPEGKVWWEFDLEFVAHDVPAEGIATFSAVYEQSNASDLSQHEWDTLWRTAAHLVVAETQIHLGDLPLAFPLSSALSS